MNYIKSKLILTVIEEHQEEFNNLTDQEVVEQMNKLLKSYFSFLLNTVKKYGSEGFEVKYQHPDFSEDNISYVVLDIKIN